jgi:hypothetical protein
MIIVSSAVDFLISGCDNMADLNKGTFLKIFQNNSACGVKIQSDEWLHS